jgi:hypothetical protein
VQVARLRVAAQTEPDAPAAERYRLAGQRLRKVDPTAGERCHGQSHLVPFALGKDGVDKTALSESDICDRYITPALERAGWATEQWRREFGFTDGKMIVRGNLVARGKPAGPTTSSSTSRTSRSP